MVTSFELFQIKMVLISDALTVCMPGSNRLKRKSLHVGTFSPESWQLSHKAGPMVIKLFFMLNSLGFQIVNIGRIAFHPIRYQKYF